MFKNRKLRIIITAMFLVFSVTFYFGVFANPNFNIYDFCMNLSSEVLGLVVALILVDAYIEEKKKTKNEGG